MSEPSGVTRPQHRIPHLRPGADWTAVPEILVNHFHRQSSPFRPVVKVKVAHADDCLFLRWTVEDRYVLSRVTKTNGPVCTDSCVECFIQPVAGRGYFNCEVNAGGTVLCHFTEGLRPTPDSPFAKQTPLTLSEIAHIRVRSSLPSVIREEISDPLTWQLEVTIPMSILRPYAGSQVATAGTWRANFFHCADDSSHPRWASWSGIGEILDFHQPTHFGTLQFE